MSENQAVGHSKKSRLERWTNRLRDPTQLGQLRRPFSRDHSRQSSREPSPVPSRGKSYSTPATAGASSSTPESRPGVVNDTQLVAGTNTTIPAIKLDDRLDEKSDDDQNVESDDKDKTEVMAATDRFQLQEYQDKDLETNTDAADSGQEDDMWKIAEAQLRRDEKMNKLLDAYDEILKSKLKNLDSFSTPERQKQISAFIESKSESFQDASKLDTFASVLKKAANCILKAEKAISAAAQPCLPASIVCAGVMLVLSVSSLWLLHAPDTDAQIALCSSRQSAGRSLQKPR